jgi:hypothetical protein
MTICVSTMLRNQAGGTGSYKAAYVNGTPYLAILVGSVPALGDGSVPGALLGTLAIAQTFSGDPSTGTLTLSAITAGSVQATGGAGVWCIYKLNDNPPGTNATSAMPRIWGSIAASGQDFNFAAGTQFQVGGTITVSSFTLTVPQSGP